METKPFSLQSPEQIAKDYGGNKQKIAEAMQMGIVDPTAGTLAGMFIDRMRAAQVQEMAPQATVAQQVMGGLPPAPPQAPPPPSGGLGATPQAGPPMAPDMSQMPQDMGAMAAPAEEAMPAMAEGGMVPPYASGGGLSDLPVPDTMFDEPSNGGFNDGYAGGGLVAFARGGYSDFHKAIIAKESGGRYGLPNAEGSGAMGLGQIMPDTARALAKRLGLPYRPELLARDDDEARRYQDALTAAATKEAWDYGKGNAQLAAQYYFAGPNKEGWGPKTQAYGSDIMARLGGEAIPMPRDVDTSTIGGRAISLEDALAAGAGMIKGLPREELERAKKYALEQLDEETQKKEAKADMWEGLAAMGFRLAGSSSPNILQAIGEAATATLPELKLSKKERKAAKDEAIRTLMAAEDVDRKTAIAGVEAGMDIYKTGISADQAKRVLAFQQAQLAQQKDLETQRLGIERYRALHPTMSDLESTVNYLRQENPNLTYTDAVKKYFELKQAGSGSGGIPGVTDTGGGSGDVIDFSGLK